MATGMETRRANYAKPAVRAKNQASLTATAFPAPPFAPPGSKAFPAPPFAPPASRAFPAAPFAPATR